MSVIIARPSSNLSAAPNDSQYVVLSSSTGLQNERVLSAGTGIEISDSGAGNNVTISVNAISFDHVSGTFPVCNEIPSGSVDGANSLFQIAYEPNDIDCIRVFLNGVSQKSGSSEDYVISGTRFIQLNNIPDLGDKIIVDYYRSGTVALIGTRNIFLPICQEIPSGALNGTNTLFSLSQNPSSVSHIKLYVNGVRQVSGSTADYIASEPRTIQMQYALSASDVFYADYFITSASVAAPNDATYIVTSFNSVLTDERVLTASDGIQFVDGGPGSYLTLSLVRSQLFPPVLQLSTSTQLTTASIVLADATLNDVTFTLPSASLNQQFVIKKVDATTNSVFIYAAGSQTIDGSQFKEIDVQWTAITVVSTDSAWYII